MATLYVRKDGSGTHTQIQSAVYDAANNDIIDIGAGIFNENIDMMQKSITLQGAGRDVTTIQGKATNDTFTCSWFAGDDTLTATSTSGALRGAQVSGTNITSGSRISQIVSSTQIKINPATPTTGNYSKTVAASQTISFPLAPTSGTFKLVYGSYTSAAINWNDSAATIQTKIRAMTGLSTVTVTGSISGKLLTIAFDGVALPVTQMTVSSNLISPSMIISVSLVNALIQGSSTITLPNTTSVAVGHKVEGTGVNATITALNATTKVITLSSPITQTGSGILLTFRLPRTSVSVNQLAQSTGSTVPATIQLYGVTSGVTIKNLTAIGFDSGNPGQEAAALGLAASVSPGHQNLMVDGCRFTAAGDSSVICGSNPYLNNCTFQNCLFDGNTFTGSEPADLPSFSSFTATGTVKSTGVSSSVITFTDIRGITVGQTFTCPLFTGSGTISAINGLDATIDKVITPVGASAACTFTLVAYKVPNAARNLVYIGQNTSPCNTQNITFKNNTVKGSTGAVISSSGNKAMFNSAVTIESVGGLVENNVIDGNFGAGNPNSLAANFAIRCRQANIVVQNNVNKTSGGRGNSGFYISGSGAVNQNNVTISMGVVQATQSAASSVPVANMDKDQLKSMAKVSADPIFSDETNWVQVSYIFKHKTSAKRMVATFRKFDLSTTDEMPFHGGQSGDQYELNKIILRAANRVILNIKRAELSDPSLCDYTLK